ncbi:21615_t:CDS:2, partial [Racocetra persica]
KNAICKKLTKNDQEEVNGCFNTLVILIPPDPENYYRPVHDFKYYFSKKPKNSDCLFFYLQINKHAKDLSKDK